MNSPTLFPPSFGMVMQNSGTYLGDFGVVNFLRDTTFQDTLGGSWDISMVKAFC